MPIYEFYCKKCNKNFEILLLNSNEKLRCPQCKESENLSRRFSAFGMKSSGKFISSKGNSCSGCTSHNCSSCGH